MNGQDDENLGLNELLEIRNSKQVTALEELWSQSGNETESDLMRNRLMTICLKCCKQVGTELGGIIHVYETSDGAKYKMTSKTGMAESISLKSDIWDYIKCYDDSLTLVEDSQGRPICFAFNKEGKTTMIKHSSVPKAIMKEPLDEEDILTGYPPMLPNSKHLDVSYMLECGLEPAPNYWID